MTAKHHFPIALLTAGLVALTPLAAQSQLEEPSGQSAAENGDDLPDLPPPPPPNLPADEQPDDGQEPSPDPERDDSAGPDVEPTTPPDEQPDEQPGDQAGEAAGEAGEAAATEPILESDSGFIIKDAALNDIFQFLAKEAGRQYFHNSKIDTPEYNVTGHLNDGDPLQQMEELAFMYGLTLYTKGDTVYALNSGQLTQLPNKEFTYRLRYLRPDDIEQIKGVIKPVLSPGTGIVNFEPKTNTVIIIDTAHRIEKAEELLRKIDQPQGQIIVETKILRVNSGAAERSGVDWSSSLGETGTSLEVLRSLNGVFGIDSALTSEGATTGTSLLGSEVTGATENLVLSPIQMNGVLRALNSGDFATQISNPTLITEDNEQGTIAIIDRIPIITTTTNSSTGDFASVSEEVRYKIDESDQTITDAPEEHREIGISMVITPTLLPDGTVRMKLRPRSAQIVDEVVSPQGNSYPRVTESMIESISRVPDGHSLVVGGFYGEVENKDRNKVPLLGDIPGLGFFFKNKQTEKEQASLVFIVTPTSYDPASPAETAHQSDRIHSKVQLTRDHDWVDTENPGPAHKPNLRRTVRGLRQSEQAPYYPTEEEMRRARPARPVETGEDQDDEPRFSRARRR